MHVTDSDYYDCYGPVLRPKIYLDKFIWSGYVLKDESGWRSFAVTRNVEPYINDKQMQSCQMADQKANTAKANTK